MNHPAVSNRFLLSNGRPIPSVGFGTWRMPEGVATVSAVLTALACGYRHIDTASGYKNEASVGAALRHSSVDRADLFITGKLWNADRGYDAAMRAFETTLANLRLDYLDLYLIHWPASPSQFPDWEDINRDTWRALTSLYRSGRIRAIGVSNFLPHHLAALLDAEIPPMVNQIEIHPGQPQAETVAFCQSHGILVEAWAPLCTGRVMDNPVLGPLSARYEKSIAQLSLRWCLQKGILPLPKSVTPARIEENLDVLDFVIADEDMAAIDAIPYFGGSGLHPDQITF